MNPQKTLEQKKFDYFEKIESQIERCYECGYHSIATLDDTFEAAVELMREEAKELVDSVEILLDDADFFTGDVRKLTAFERLQLALAAYREKVGVNNE